MWFICSLRPAGSTPCLLPTTPHGVAVGSVFAAEPSNCTGGNFIRVDVRFTGALKVGVSSVKSGPLTSPTFNHTLQTLKRIRTLRIPPFANTPSFPLQ